MRLGVAHALVDDVHGRDVELRVRRRRAVADAREAAGLGEVGRERAGLRRFELLQRGGLEREQQALGLGRRPHELRGGVIGQVLADRGLVEQQLDFAHRQVFGGSDAGEHEQLRRVVGAAAEDHLALGAQLLGLPELAGFDADRLGALEQHAAHVHVGHHGEVRPLGGRVQVGDGGARAHAAALGHLVHADAVLLVPVEVVVARHASLLAGVDEGVRDAVVRALLADRQRAAGPVPLRRAALVVLGLDEVGQQVGGAPAGDAPVVVVAAVAADVDHRVDRRGAAEHAPARQRDATPAALVLGRRVVVPVDLRAAELQIAERHVDVLQRVRRAGLEQQHLHVWVLAETVGEHTTRRSCTDDHVVVHFSRPPSSAANDTPPPAVERAVRCRPEPRAGWTSRARARRAT